MIVLKDIKEKIGTQFRITDVDDKPDVFRCERIYGKEPYQIFYFDCSDKLSDISDINGYTESLLGAEYYRNSGHLQWNYYIAFITSQSIDRKTVSRIERNVEYARKLVIPVDGIDEWLATMYDVMGSEDAPIAGDLSETWDNILRQNGLACIADYTPPTSGVPEILSGWSEDSKEKTVKVCGAANSLRAVFKVGITGFQTISKKRKRFYLQKSKFNNGVQRFWQNFAIGSH